LTDDALTLAFANVPERSIILLEDIDAVWDARRSVVQSSTVTFDAFLQVLDGIVSYRGSILIMTTNHPEKLDSALTRSGRVDIRCEFEMADADQIERLVWSYLNPSAAASLQQKRRLQLMASKKLLSTSSKLFDGSHILSSRTLFCVCRHGICSTGNH
jgi:ATP-dependent 26S proteasome regulatory subunit